MGPKPFEVHGTPDLAKKSVRVYRKLQETRDKRHYKKIRMPQPLPAHAADDYAGKSERLSALSS